MNENKIAFIISVFDERQCSECRLYINNLDVPSNFEAEVIVVRPQKSLAEAYNKGLDMTDAKYKVYLHSGTFIINKKFIKDILNIFSMSKEIGLIGVVGAKRLPANGMWQQDPGTVGKLYVTEKGFVEELKYNDIMEKYENVEVIDGLLMATQADTRWRDDIFDGRAFYDISHCMEYLQKGLQVVVARQEKPWCLYEGTSEVNGSYEIYRKRFIREYPHIQSRNQQLPEDLFNFNKYEAMQILMGNRIKLQDIMENMKNCVKNGDYETTSRYAFDFALSASTHHPGFFVSPEIESMLLTCAENLPQKDYVLKSNKDGNRRVLHVLSEGYAIGGHTRLVKNCIKSDGDSIHSLVTTWQINSTPRWLIEEIEKSGGWKLSLINTSDKHLERAALLRKLAYEWADVVVLHMHMYDPIPVLAFGVEGGPPVVYMNHADHSFWLGASIADMVIDIRPSGQEITLARRGGIKSYILPIPLQSKKAFDRAEVRKKYGIKDDEIVMLTIASAFKFRSINDNNYLDIVKQIVDKVDNLRVLVVGPGNAGRWHEVNIATGGRIQALGRLSEIEEYYQIADIYLDCFMIGSLTSLLDASKYGLPIIKFRNSYCPILTEYDEEFYVCSFDNINGVIEELYKLKNNMKKYQNITDSIIKNHISDTKEKIHNIYKALGRHRINRWLKISNNVEDQDLFWCLLMRKGYIC
ncbi:glycosyltransferase [Clostridium thermarum]|uniref:glycosyltransferase n=1 Tax=Clostridium thermarum TaxID=1716543 RepID=UPI0011228417|nr:glycosyltransferase [Clostridium thermarum]